MADEGTTATAPAPNSVTPQAPISSDPTPAAPAAPAAYDWKAANLSPEHATLVTERGWKSPDDVMKSYRNLETATGVPPERLIKLPAPKDANDPKAWNDIYTKLGRPETADKYVIPLPEGDKGEFANAMRPILHKAGVSQSQATVLATELNALTAANQKAQQTELAAMQTKEVSDLKQAWGTDYENRAALVDKAAENFGWGQEHLDAFKIALGPKLAMETLYKIGSSLGMEDKTVPGMSGQSTSLGLTAEAAAARITQLKSDKDFAKLFNSSDTKQRMEARNEISRLHQIAYPGMTPVPGAVGRK